MRLHHQMAHVPPFVVRNSIRTYYDQVAMPSLPPEFSGVYDLEQTFTLGARGWYVESESVQSWYSYDDQGKSDVGTFSIWKN